MSDQQTSPEAGAPAMDRPAFLLSSLGVQVANEFTERLRPLGLEPIEFALLAHLESAEGSSQQTLAEALGVHRNAMVGLVDELETRGLVQRHPHPDDRRAKALHLTERARELVERGYRAADEHDADLLSTVEESERPQLISLLRRVAEDRGVSPRGHPCLTQHSGPVKRSTTDRADEDSR
ncbi:MarR family winged helix-turn-helix transcriptional regulator [Actinopolyspora saharensis]|uniref:MarR family winged helix-turn-helix transcriptional regulator n=1 Tax=Actinopolyspora saharensis TaxID=995062 RepID=UPI003F66392B